MQTEGSSVYIVSCGAEYLSLQWLGPTDFEEAVAPIVDELVRRVTVLPAGVHIRPDNRGVTGIPSFFWVEGYGDSPLEQTESAFGLTVTVTVRLAGVEWDFGDGTHRVSAGLGEAWPQRSSVSHNYRNPSSNGAFDVTAELEFQPSYTVDGDDGDPLEPITIEVTRDYAVHEVQAIRRT